MKEHPAWPTVQHISVTFPEWPHDTFVAVLLPSGNGEVYRQFSTLPLGAITCSFGGWEVHSCRYHAGDDAIRAIVQAAIDQGALTLATTEPPDQRPA